MGKVFPTRNTFRSSFRTCYIFLPGDKIALPLYHVNYECTLFTADTFAPALINILTASLCPYRAAMCNGRMPNLKQEKWILIN